ncbi:MAG: HDIG domain-containing protein [Deltaproteobacteria bacterium]|nr:HDIG domain-containing protein [Deltaproteobacteria bacterium]
MRFFLSATLVVFSFLACYTEDLVCHFFPPRQGSAALITFRAQHPFNFDQEKAFGSRRNVALAQYIPIYTFVPERAEEARKRMHELSRRLVAIQSLPSPDVSEAVRAIRKEFRVEMTAEEASLLLHVTSLDRTLDAILTIVESILQGRIVEDAEPIKGKATAEVLFPPPVGTIAYPAGEFITAEEAKQNLRKSVSQVLWQTDEDVLNLLLRITSALIVPNLRYDRMENDRRIEAIIRRYPTVVVPYSAGDVLVPFRKTLREEDLLLLNDHKEFSQKEAMKTAPWVLLSIVLLVLFHDFLHFRLAAHPFVKRINSSQLMTTLILTVVLARACLLYTTLPIYALPIAILPLLLFLLGFDRFYAVGTAVLGAMLITLFSGRTIEILFFFMFGATLALISCPEVRKPYHVLLPAAAVGLLNVVVLLFLGTDWGGLEHFTTGRGLLPLLSAPTIAGKELLRQLPWAFAGGLSAGPLALLVLPALEWPWNTASTFRLHKYTDLQHPLLRELLTRAPGTYQHTMAVAHLAQAAGEAVGANVLLLRAGAYYHDIGKMIQPRYFIENQMGAKNPHDELEPMESAKILFAHVEKGQSMGKEAGIPDAILDFIPQHHGTLMAEYFYHKAVEARGNPPPREEDYRYPGPKPQSVETAILMVCDAVEATSRTLQEPSHDSIRKMVWRITEKRLEDGQFAQCDLSTRDLSTIVDVLCRTLEASLHARVEYPWQKEIKEMGQTGSPGDS